MTRVAIITNALLDARPMLALPRYRVLADVRQRFGCSEFAARTAYALARIEAHARTHHDTVPHARKEWGA